MLEKSATYHKSAKGAEALATRHQGTLSPRLRSMLILVDGRRSLAELARLGQVLGDPVELLAQLEAEGCIESAPHRTGPPTGPAPLLDSSWGPVSAPAPLTDAELPLTQVRRFAVARLQDLMGPEADDLCARLEEAATPHEFQAAVQRTEAVLKAVLGPELAAQFTRDVERVR